MDKFFQKISKLIMILLMVNIVIAILLQMVGRVISKPFSWTLEFSCYNFTWLVFFGAVTVLRDGKHIHVSYFVERMPRSVRIALFYFRHLLALASMLFLLKPAFSYAKAGYAMKSAAMHLPMLYVDGIVFVSFILLCFETVRQLKKGYHYDDYVENREGAAK